MTLACAVLLKLRRSGLGLLKSAFNVENFIRRLSWSISSHFVADSQFTLKLHVAARNCEKLTKSSYFGGSKSFKVIDVDIPKKLVASACYDKQHVCAYMHPFSYTSQ